MSRGDDAARCGPSVPERGGALPSEHYDDRPPGSVVDTVVVHTMCAPGAEPFSPAACKACLDEHGVSTHYFIARDGMVWTSVPEVRRAWHAGESRMPDPEDGRAGVNAFSIGIELLASETSGCTGEQYRSLAALIVEIHSRSSLRTIVGHADIAPGRKTDPWRFDWERLRGSVRELQQNFPAVIGCQAGR